ncbi:hypothetical protein BH23ACT12_BH23ACT12_15470 [soil metagenome]
MEIEITEEHRKGLALWAADCAERVLPIFQQSRPDDRRPRKAIDSARAWARGELPMMAARAASSASHTAAREADEGPAREAARAAGHASATVHAVGHAIHAAAYAVKALADAGGAGATSAEKEQGWQFEHLPEHLRPLVYPEEPAD